MDFSKLSDKISSLAEQGGNMIEDAATSVKDKVVDLVPDSVKEKAEALAGRATDAATGALGMAADKLSGDKPSGSAPSSGKPASGASATSTPGAGKPAASKPAASAPATSAPPTSAPSASKPPATPSADKRVLGDPSTDLPEGAE